MPAPAQEAGPSPTAAGAPTTPTAAAARSAAGTSAAAPATGADAGAGAPIRSLANRGLPASVYLVLSLACLAMAAACLGVPGLVRAGELVGWGLHRSNPCCTPGALEALEGFRGALLRTVEGHPSCRLLQRLAL